MNQSEYLAITLNFVKAQEKWSHNPRSMTKRSKRYRVLLPTVVAGFSSEKVILK